MVLDVTPALPQKEKAAMCHRTQHALFVRSASEEAGRQLTVPEVIMHLEEIHRLHPPAKAGNNIEDQLVEMLKPWEWRKNRE